MGKRSGGQHTMVPRRRKPERTLLSTVLRTLFVALVIGSLLFAAAGFYYAGLVRDGALIPPDSAGWDYPLVVTAVDGDQVSVTGSGQSDQIGQPGFEGIQWDGGYARTKTLISSTEDEAGEPTDVRELTGGDAPPSIGTEVRLDSYAYPNDPMTAFGLEYETIRYASDIDTFPAWYIDGGVDTWVIFVHGKGGTSAGALRTMPFFNSLDFPILSISYRNDFGSAKDPSGYHQFGATEWVDLDGAVRYAKANGAREVILVGHSMGGAIVTSWLVNSGLRSMARAVILDSPALDFAATVEYGASQTGLPLIGASVPGPLTTFAKWVAGWRYGIDWAGTDWNERWRELHAPILIFHGTNDLTVPISSSIELARLRPDIVTLVTTEAGHVRSWNEGPTDYQEKLVSFLVDNR